MALLEGKHWTNNNVRCGLHLFSENPLTYECISTGLSEFESVADPG